MEQILLDFYNRYCKKADWLPYIQSRIENRQLHIPIFLEEDEKQQGDDYYLDVLIDLDRWDIVMTTDGYEIDMDKYFNIMQDLKELTNKIKGRNK